MATGRTKVAALAVCAALLVLALSVSWRLVFPPPVVERPADDGLAPLNRTVSGNFSLRLYGDNRPFNGKLAPLQKGTVLVYRENETIGEGGGFGSPVLEHAGKTYFSHNATLKRLRDGVQKEFKLDSVEVGPTHRTVFESVEPIGSVRVSYRYMASGLNISVSLSGIPKNSTLHILNEQSGREYFKYRGPDGTEETVNWSWREAGAGKSFMLNGDGKGFGLDWPGGREGISLHTGREIEPANFDWSGLDITVDTAAYASTVISYELRISD